MIVIEERKICRMLEGLFQFDKECEWNDAIEEAMHRFVNLPTIEAEPVRHGRWVRITTGGIGIYMCNQCGRQIETDSVQGLVPIRYPYCHCGAKMDGERRTDE